MLSSCSFGYMNRLWTVSFVFFVCYAANIYLYFQFPLSELSFTFDISLYSLQPEQHPNSDVKLSKYRFVFFFFRSASIIYSFGSIRHYLSEEQTKRSSDLKLQVIRQSSNRRRENRGRLEWELIRKRIVSWKLMRLPHASYLTLVVSFLVEIDFRWIPFR